MAFSILPAEIDFQEYAFDFEEFVRNEVGLDITNLAKKNGGMIFFFFNTWIQTHCGLTIETTTLKEEEQGEKNEISRQVRIKRERCTSTLLFVVHAVGVTVLPWVGFQDKARFL
jgi:hypothetical protein